MIRVMMLAPFLILLSAWLDREEKKQAVLAKTAKQKKAPDTGRNLPAQRFRLALVTGGLGGSPAAALASASASVLR